MVKKIELSLELPPRRFLAQWLNPRTGNIDKKEQLECRGRPVEIVSPAYAEHVALGIRTMRAP
jgi:hypothetical protein